MFCNARRAPLAFGGLTLFLTVALAAGVIAVSPATAPADDAAAQGQAEESLHDLMETINTTLRQLRRSAARPDTRDDALEQVTVLQVSAVKAKGMVPSSIQAEPVADQPALIASYRGMMINLVEEMLKLERAIMSGDTDAINAHVKELLEIRMKGHLEFKVDD